MKRQLLSLFLLLMLGGLAFGQSANIPVCDGTNGPNCTDYFGAGNYANSPLPAGTVTGFTLVAGGSGYINPSVVITDPLGTGATALATQIGGVITEVTGTGNGGSGYIMPQVTIVDLGPCVPACGTGALATAVLGGPFTGGIRKFMDPLPNLAFAVPDTTTFPGSDYYVIELQQYSTKMHTALQPTTLRGYKQLNKGTDANGQNTVLPPPISYLGPTIIAQKNRPVRVLFKNMLPTGAGGNLFIPTDTTYMGAGAPYTQNRATLHLHGGATPWISDGTPHQWTTPIGESPARGDSVQFVPDMWFDASGNLVPAGTPGATNDPGAGNLTFFWTNQQGGRLMFYHDHAYGITRLNVYAGEAAGYLLYDPAEESVLAAATSPGSITAGDLNHLVPLVIQDKTFVPSAEQIRAQDPTWELNFGTNTGFVNPGDLWFPHVYMPNQNPADPNTANAFGRWDYGPWFFPPQTSLTAGPTTVNCTSSAFPSQTIQCPIPPNPSGTPESFMDTPVVNGKAYPVLHVAPAAYRFQILSAGNDRSWNLSWFVADLTREDVAMLQAVPPPANSLPLCGAINPVAVPSLVLGVVTALMDGGGNPINGTGLPAGCWPNYGPQQGIPAPQTMWAADGRVGGAPDPRTAGPPWIQIGTEGGLLPAPVVIPATPINYEQNTRSITIGSVAMHGLWLGPAERADAIVDFSQFAGKTLILYNDAPTPAPAFDSRLDYFTGDGDQTPIGGAPNTQPGYGPNTRTIMQVVVDGSGGNMVPFSLQTLKAAFASTATTAGLFASTQPTPIVPEAAYNSAYNQTFPNTYASIQANSLAFTPIAPLTFDQPCTLGSTTCDNLDQKAIQELFTLDYGRMNATLGVEIPLTNFQNQTTIPYGYVDWPTEIIQDGQTQLWKITHNGVDTHFIHFHLFNVQVVNRVGWDGSMRPPDSNEVGWKDTVRMNPLEDILVALQPIRPSLPFPIRDSIRLMDVTNTPGSISGLDPLSGNATISTGNKSINFGWEYVWHCHILGHEENDMMRPIIFQVAPPAPSNLVVTTATSPATGVNVAFIDKSASETSFNLERSVNDPNFLTPADITAIPLPTSSPNTAYGGAITANDPTPPPGTLYYRVQAVDDFGPQSPLVSPFQTATLFSAWSNTASIGAFPIAALSPATPLLFGSVSLLSPSGPQTVSLLNNGAVPLGIISIGFTGLNPGDFLQANPCGTSLAANSSCLITVTFRPTALSTRSAALTINSNDPNNPTLTVSVTGTGIGPVAVVSPTVVSFGNQLVRTTSTVTKTVTLSNAGSTGSTLTINSITMGGANPGDFAQTNTCGGSLAAGASCPISVTFTPTVVGGRGAALTINTSDPVNPAVTSQLTGTGIAPVAVVSPTLLAFGNQKQQTTSAPNAVTLSNTGTAPLTINSIAIGGTNAGDFKQTNTCGGSLAAGGNCTISVTFRPAKKGTRTATLTVTDNSKAVNNSQQNVSLGGTGQ